VTARQVAMLLGLAALWGASFLFIAIAVPAFGAIGLADARVLLATAVLALPAALRGALPHLRARPGAWFVLGTTNVAIPFALICFAQLTIPASLAAIVNATTPLWGVLVGAVALGQRVTGLTVVGLATGVAGVAMVVGLSPVEGGLDTVLAVSASAGAGLCYAVGSHFAKQNFTGEAPSTMAIGQLFTAGVVLLPLVLLVQPREVPTGGELAAVAALAVGSTSLAYLLYFRLIDEVGVNSTLTVTYLVPVFGVLWATLFRDEHFTGGMIAGSALVLVGVALVTRGGRGARAPVPAATRQPA
jgi:drug/metabolite transporter (DMT)-like permease